MSDFHVAVSRAVAIVGGQAKLAVAVGCAQSEIWRLCNTAKSIPAATAVKISQATDGKVPLRDLMPEVVEAVAAEIAASFA